MDEGSAAGDRRGSRFMSSPHKAAAVLLTAWTIGGCAAGPPASDLATRPPVRELVSPTAMSPVRPEIATVPPIGSTPTVRGPTATAPSSNLPACSRTATIELGTMELAIVAEWDGDEDVYLIRGDGSDLRQFTDNPGWDTGPVWTKDGQQLAFVIDGLTAPRAHISAADGSEGHVVAPELEVTTVRVDLSPNGDLVAFRNLEDLYVVNTLTGEQTLLTPGADINPSNPRFSPAGTKLLFTADSANGDDDDLFVVNSDGTGLTKLTSVVKSVHRPAWHPTEDKILFEQRIPGEGIALHVVGLDGVVEKLPIVPKYRASSAAWSPDGNMIGYIFRLFGVDSQGESVEKNSLHIATADGIVDLEVVKPPDEPDAELRLHELAWAPDSRHIAYTTVTEGRTDLFVLDICDGSSLLIAEDVDFYSTPSWRPLP